VDHGLPIWTHVTGVEYILQGCAVPAGGFPESYGERRTMTAQLAEANLSSIALSGVLQRYPDLKFCFSEFGFSWALSLLWRMDDTWRACRRDFPWIVNPPSQSVHERVRFTTQPLDEPARPDHLLKLVEMLGPDLLLFSSDYPHWDNDNPHRVLRSWPQELRTAICSTNPRAFWPL
jgi:predicted TIM-barrel fold metal-dependent hydrolase